MRIAVSLVLASLGASAIAQTIPTLTPAAMIAARQAGYDLMGADMDGLKAAVESGADVKPLADRAKAVQRWGETIPMLFPEGTQTGGNTKARPEIWSDRGGFETAASNMATQAGKLVAAAESGDKDAFKTQFAATGQACGACHRAYRAR